MSEQLAIDFSGPEERRKVSRVLAIVRQRRGRERAVSMHEIALQADLATRDVQAIVKFLVEERHVPIGSAMARPYGYFLITSDLERRRCRNHFMRRALSNLAHAKAYDTDSIVAPLIGQLELGIVAETEEPEGVPV